MNNCLENTNEENVCTEPLGIGSIAPNFSATTTCGEISLSSYRGKWLVFFSHPGDFTPVCTTEFIAFTQMESEFKKINCELLGLSIDSNPSHLAWLYSIAKSTGLTVNFPVIADRDAKIAKLYNMFPATNQDTSTIRSVYIICPKGYIRAILTYPKEIGRNIGEILRIVTALQTSDRCNVVLPASWVPGMNAIEKIPTTYNQLIERMECPQGLSCMDWYLCFKTDTSCEDNVNGK